MVKLYDGGVYLVNGVTLTQDLKEAEALSGQKTCQDCSRKGTMAYSIIKAHNQSDDMEHLQLKYDSMTVAQTNIRMAIESNGIHVVFPENTTGRAGY